MAPPLEFLIVDDHVDNPFLLTKTLLRKYPAALLQECQDSATAITAAKRATLTAAVVHRAADVDGLPLLALLRQANPTLPILYVSGFNHGGEAFRAGATAFLNYDAWLRVGTAVEEMLRVPPSS